MARHAAPVRAWAVSRCALDRLCASAVARARPATLRAAAAHATAMCDLSHAGLPPPPPPPPPPPFFLPLLPTPTPPPALPPPLLPLLLLLSSEAGTTTTDDE